jgi:hypothetical protein
MAVKTFTSGEVLTAADTNTYLANSGLVYITGASFSAVTEVLLDNVFTATYRNYFFLIECQSSAGSNIFTWQVRSSGTTIGGSSYQRIAQDLDASANVVSRVTGQSSIRVGANDTNAYHGLQMNIFCPAIAQATRITSFFNRNSGYQAENVWGGNTNNTAYDGMRLAVASGNMTGAYALYGYRIA